MRRFFPMALGLAAAVSGCGDPPAPAAAPATAPATAAAAGPRFEECAEAKGLAFRTNFLPFEQGLNFRINLYDHGCGVVVADFDGDGDDDAYLLNQLGSNALFRNKGDGTFEDATKDSGTDLEARICVAAAAADADGDGDADLFVTTTRGGNAYLVNEGGMKFRDATKEAGLELVSESEMPVFFDADGDGDLDLFVGNTARWTLEIFDNEMKYWRGKRTLDELIDSERLKDVFYLNDGKGKFTVATKEAGLEGKGWSGDVAVFDADGDGDLDLFVCNMFGASTLHRNDGKGKFTDATREMLGKTSWGAVGARAFDYDGDGILDLFIADMHSDMWMPFDFDPALVEEKRKYVSFMARMIELGTATPDQDAEFEAKAGVKREEVVFGNTLFRGLGGGKYEEVSDKAGAETFWPWGCVEGDYDGDGFQDAFIPSGMGFPLFYWRSPLLRNKGDGTFEDVCRAAGMEPPPGGNFSPQTIGGRPAARSARCAATADFDGDGRLDLLVSNFNDRAFLYRNTSAPGRWLAIRLVATRSNRDAIGALVKVTAGGRTHLRQVQAAGGYLSQSSNRLHFGLGKADSIEKLEIRWPSGQVQVIEKPKIDAVTVITEPK